MSSWNTVLRDAWTVPTCDLNELTVKGGNVMRADSIQKTNKLALLCAADITDLRARLSLPSNLS